MSVLSGSIINVTPLADEHVAGMFAKETSEASLFAAVPFKLALPELDRAALIVNPHPYTDKVLKVIDQCGITRFDAFPEPPSKLKPIGMVKSKISPKEVELLATDLRPEAVAVDTNNKRSRKQVERFADEQAKKVLASSSTTTTTSVTPKAANKKRVRTSPVSKAAAVEPVTPPTSAPPPPPALPPVEARPTQGNKFPRLTVYTSIDVAGNKLEEEPIVDEIYASNALIGGSSEDRRSSGDDGDDGNEIDEALARQHSQSASDNNIVVELDDTESPEKRRRTDPVATMQTLMREMQGELERVTDESRQRKASEVERSVIERELETWKRMYKTDMAEKEKELETTARAYQAELETTKTAVARSTEAYNRILGTVEDYKVEHNKVLDMAAELAVSKTQLEALTSSKNALHVERDELFADVSAKKLEIEQMRTKAATDAAALQQAQSTAANAVAEMQQAQQAVVALQQAAQTVNTAEMTQLRNSKMALERKLADTEREISAQKHNIESQATCIINQRTQLKAKDDELRKTVAEAATRATDESARSALNRERTNVERTAQLAYIERVKASNADLTLERDKLAGELATNTKKLCDVEQELRKSEEYRKQQSQKITDLLAQKEGLDLDASTEHAMSEKTKKMYDEQLESNNKLSADMYELSGEIAKLTGVIDEQDCQLKSNARTITEYESTLSLLKNNSELLKKQFNDSMAIHERFVDANTRDNLMRTMTIDGQNKLIETRNAELARLKTKVAELRAKNGRLIEKALARMLTQNSISDELGEREAEASSMFGLDAIASDDDDEPGLLHLN